MALTINTNIVNDADNYSLDAKQVKGTYVAVSTIAERDGLPAATIIKGSLCYVTATDKYYKYNGSAWEDAKFGGGDVTSVNSKTGDVVLNASDVGALPDTTIIPTKTSELTNDSGFLTEHQSLSNYDTKEEVNTKISTATNDMATQTWVEGKGYLTEHQSLKTINNQSIIGSGNIDIEGGEIAKGTTPPTDPTIKLWIDESEEYDSPEALVLKTINDISLFGEGDIAMPTKTSELENDSGFICEHQDISSKLSEPCTGLSVGKYFRIASIDENGHAVLECADAPSGGEMKLKIAGTAQTPDSDGYVDVPKAGSNSANSDSKSIGLVWCKVNITSGLTIDNNGYISVSRADVGDIGTNRSRVITPQYFGSYFKAYNARQTPYLTYTDIEKGYIWRDQSIIKTTLDSVLVPLSQYYLGEQSSLELTLPSAASAGQTITVDFASGSTPTTLTITGNVAGDVTYTPSANTLVEINFKFDGTYWKMFVSSVDTPTE